VRPGDRPGESCSMHAAILLFDGFSALDAVTPHAALTSAGVGVTFTAEVIGPVRADSRSVEITADAALGEIPAPDIIVISGGAGIYRHLRNGSVHKWLRAADVTADAVLAVGTGTLVLASAGLLSGSRAAANDSTSAFLMQHRAIPIHEPTVIDGKYGTAVNVGSADDLVRDVLTKLRIQNRSTNRKGDLA
jgi:putative intracellular protease/amidase